MKSFATFVVFLSWLAALGTATSTFNGIPDAPDATLLEKRVALTARMNRARHGGRRHPTRVTSESERVGKERVQRAQYHPRAAPTDKLVKKNLLPLPIFGGGPSQPQPSQSSCTAGAYDTCNFYIFSGNSCCQTGFSCSILNLGASVCIQTNNILQNIENFNQELLQNSVSTSQQLSSYLAQKKQNLLAQQTQALQQLQSQKSQLENDCSSKLNTLAQLSQQFQASLVGKTLLQKQQLQQQYQNQCSSLQQDIQGKLNSLSQLGVQASASLSTSSASTFKSSCDSSKTNLQSLLDQHITSSNNLLGSINLGGINLGSSWNFW